MKNCAEMVEWTQFGMIITISQFTLHSKQSE